MATVTLNTHIQNKQDTAANWANSSYIPKDGELAIVKRPDGNVDIKVGDSINIIGNLPGTYTFQPLRFTSLNYGSIDRVFYNGFTASPGINVGDYALLVSNRSAYGREIGSILRVNSITEHESYADIYYNTVWSPSQLIPSATPSLYYHLLEIRADGYSTPISENNVFITLNGLGVYSSDPGPSVRLANYPAIKVAGGTATDHGPNHYTYEYTHATVNGMANTVTLYLTNGVNTTFEYKYSTSVANCKIF